MELQMIRTPRNVESGSVKRTKPVLSRIWVGIFPKMHMIRLIYSKNSIHFW